MSITNIVVLGSSYITSAIIRTLLYLPDVNIVVIDRKDPHYVLNQNLLEGMQALSTTVSDLKKNVDYTKGFKLTPGDSLSFLYYNPITDSLKIHEELSKLDKIDIVVDSAMMFDPHYAESNIIDTCNINTTYPTAFFSVLNKLSSIPQLYINLSSGIVYGKQPNNALPTKEVSLTNPVGMRAGSLLARESIVQALATAYDIPYITLRLGTPIGYYTPYENVINQIVKCQLLKQPIVIEGDGTQARDFFDLNDLSKLIFRIAANVTNNPLPRPPENQTDNIEKKEVKRLTGFEYVESIKNQVYNIGGLKTEGEAPLTLITLDRLVTTALGRIKIPEVQGKIIVKNSRTRNVPYRNSDNIEKDIRIQMDNTKAVEKLEYDPEYNILSTIKAEVIPYVASDWLGYNESEMEELKKTLRL